MLWVLAVLPLVAQPPEGCLVASAESALRAEGVASPAATTLIREVHVFADGVEPADVAEVLAHSGVTMLRFAPRPGELVQATARLPMLVTLTPGHVVAVLDGQAMDPEAPRRFPISAKDLEEVRIAYFVGDKATLERAGAEGLDIVRWRLDDAHYRAQVYTRRAAEPGANAVALLLQAAAADPSDAAVQNDLGVAYARVARYADAIAAFDHALTLAPQLTEARRNRERAVALAAPTR